jgi:hypothetical protein
MKKAFFSLLLILACPAYPQWVTLNQTAVTDVASVEFLDFSSSLYGNYILVIDNLVPKNSNYDIVLQVGIDDGIHPINWVSAYAGGISSIKAGETSIVSTEVSQAGIPITHSANQGASFVGELRISNNNPSGEIDAGINYGPVAIYGQGTCGIDVTAFIAATLQGFSAVNCLRFLPTDPDAGSDAISSAAITIYGLNQTMTP